MIDKKLMPRRIKLFFALGVFATLTTSFVHAQSNPATTVPASNLISESYLPSCYLYDSKVGLVLNTKGLQNELLCLDGTAASLKSVVKGCKKRNCLRTASNTDRENFLARSSSTSIRVCANDTANGGTSSCILIDKKPGYFPDPKKERDGLSSHCGENGDLLDFANDIRSKMNNECKGDSDAPCLFIGDDGKTYSKITLNSGFSTPPEALQSLLEICSIRTAAEADLAFAMRDKVSLKCLDDFQASCQEVLARANDAYNASLNLPKKR